MLLEPTTLAYLAGVIDSDGYITINRSVRSGHAYYGAQVGIAGTRRRPHDLAASLWGGKVSLYHPKNPRHRSQYQWSRQGDAAISIIESHSPYLRVKSEQAMLALELQEHRLFGRGDDPYPWLSPDYDPESFFEGLVSEIRSLNQSRSRGRTRDEFPLVPEGVAS